MLVTLSTYGQSIKSSEISKKESIKLAESVVDFERFSGRSLWANIFKISNGSGSAKNWGTDEVSYSFLVSLGHFDENPESKLYKIGPFVNPKVTKKVDSGNSVTIYVKDTNGRHSKRYTVVVNAARLKIKKKGNKSAQRTAININKSRI